MKKPHNYLSTDTTNSPMKPLTNEQLQHLAHGSPPSTIGFDCAEVIKQVVDDVLALRTSCARLGRWHSETAGMLQDANAELAELKKQLAESKEHNLLAGNLLSKVHAELYETKASLEGVRAVRDEAIRQADYNRKGWAHANEKIVELTKQNEILSAAIDRMIKVWMAKA